MMQTNWALRWVLSVTLWGLCSHASADTTLISPSKTRMALDIASRINLPESGPSSQMYFVGLDFHRVFSNDGSDIATVLFQPYWVDANNLRPFPNFLDDPDDSGLQWRNAFIDFHLTKSRVVNFKIGHLEIPFGAESLALDTNGTLRQLTSNLGLKVDWGASLHGDYRGFEYEVAWTRGSGNEWETGGNPGIVSGRIGRSRYHNFVWGVSWLDGDFWTPSQTVPKTRYGADFLLYHEQYRIIGDFSRGDDNGLDRDYGMLEITHESGDGMLDLYTQVRYQRNEHSMGSAATRTANIGLKWEPYLGVHISVQARVWSDHDAGNEPPELLQIQFRKRFNSGI